MHHADPRLQGNQSSGNDGLRREEERQKRAACIAERYVYNVIYFPSLSAEIPILSFNPPSRKTSSLFLRFSSLESLYSHSSLFYFLAYPRYISTGSRHFDPEIYLEVFPKSPETGRLPSRVAVTVAQSVTTFPRINSQSKARKEKRGIAKNLF